MKKHIFDEEFNKHLSQPQPGLEMQVFTSYKRKGDKLVKETITRTFHWEKDYSDNFTTEVICLLHKESSE